VLCAVVDGESHKVSVVASIVVSGVYIPNKDTHTDQYTILVYTGERQHGTG